VLYNFCSAEYCTDGSEPGSGSLIFDASGNLYGTTFKGGAYDSGTVFELSPAGNGTWTEAVLYSFDSGNNVGCWPSDGLIFDAAGDLYGTASVCGAYNAGTVFELSPGGNGTWTVTALYSFGSTNNDGATPSAGLIFDAAGDLYGTTSAGGEWPYSCHDGCGTVFELTPGTNGQWTETILHNFTNDGKDGYWPWAGLVFDGAGNLFGTTTAGPGTGCLGYGCGTVFELTPGANGWTETVVHRFGKAKDGAIPEAGLTLDSAGNFYSTTVFGGASCCGTVFELTPGTNGKWTEKVLHSFGKDGNSLPAAGVIFDAAGDLYGTTSQGGDGSGTVFKLTPGRSGKWTDTILHRFGKGKDGIWPFDGLVFDSAGNLYGTTQQGGTNYNSVYCGNYGCGTVFEVTP